MTTLRTLLLTLLVLTAMTACDDDPASPPDTTTPDAPVLLTPADAATLDAPVTLTWDGDALFTGYNLVIATDNAFTATVIDTAVTGAKTFAFTGGTPGTQYFWKVGGAYDGTTTWSAVRSFTVNDPLADAWTKCTVAIEGIAIRYELRRIRYITGFGYDTTFKAETDTITLARSFEREAQAGELFAASILRTGGDYHDGWADHYQVFASVRAADGMLDSLRYEEMESSSFQSPGGSMSRWTTRLLRGLSLGVAPASEGHYRIDDANTLASKFLMQASRYSSSSTLSSPPETWTTTRVLDVEILPGAFIDLQFE